jgi:hypothetical protein
LLDERVPGLSQRAKFFALKSGMGLLNNESRQMMQMMQVQQRQQGLELAQGRLNEQQYRDQINKQNKQYQQMGKLAEWGYVTPEAMARIMAGEDAQDVVKDEMSKGNTNNASPTAEPKDSTPNPQWGGLTKSQVDWGAVDWITKGDITKNLIARGKQGQLQQEAYKKRMEELARSAGIGPEELATNSAKVMAFRAGMRMLSTRSANINLLANEAEKMIGLVNETAGALDTTKYPSMNHFLQSMWEAGGDENTVKFGNAINSLRYIYARLLQGSGSISVNAVQDADNAMNRYWSKGQIKGMTEMVKKELQRMREGTEKTMRESTPGLTTVPLPGAGAPAPSTGWGKATVTSP